MKVTGSTIQQLDKERPNGTARPKSECRAWRIWATTEHGRKSKRFNGTYTQAQAAQAAFVEELEGAVPNAETFAAYAESWRLWREKSGQLQPGTLANDARHVAMFARCPIADRELSGITPADVREALLWMRDNPARGSVLSGTTMNKAHTCMRAVFQQAVDDGLMASNPMARIQPPKVDTEEREALSPAELSALLDALDAEPCDGRVLAVYLICCLGLRRAEACALMADDVSGGSVTVRRAVKERDGTLGPPKSPAAVRELPMPSRLAAKLSEWIPECPSEMLCPNTGGGMLRPQYLQRWWAGDSTHCAMRDKLGAHGVDLHQLRHSNLSMMARHMSPFDLQRWAGWSSIAPARVYIHDDMDSVRRAVSSAWDALEAESNAPKTHQNESRSEV